VTVVECSEYVATSTTEVRSDWPVHEVTTFTMATNLTLKVVLENDSTRKDVFQSYVSEVIVVFGYINKQKRLQCRQRAYISLTR